MDVTSYLLGKQAGGGIATETDPIFNASAASGITSGDITNWNGKQDIIQYETLPTCTEDDVDRVIQYIGTDITGVSQGDFLIGIEVGGSTITYEWDNLTNKRLLVKQDIIQVASLPTANASNLGKVYQYTGATNANYTNGYFYLCVSNGETVPTYSWEQINVQDGTIYTAGTNIDITNGVISDKIPYKEYATTVANYKGFVLGDESLEAKTGSIIIGKNLTVGSGSDNIVIGKNAQTPTYMSANSVTVIGSSAQGNEKSVAIGAASGNSSKYPIISIGYGAKATENNTIMMGSSTAPMNKMFITTSNGVKQMATEDYVDNAISTAITSALGGSY